MSMELWEKVRQVPDTAKKPISGGRLNGKTNINPVWRIKTLTEQFGTCGVGWYYEITDKRLETGSDGQIAAFVDINLYINDSTGWSKPIPGIGGSMFIEKEKSGPHTSDECFKMALTDALSVACKALGIGADVYWDEDTSKYDKPVPKPTEPPTAPPVTKPTNMLTKDQCNHFGQLCKNESDKAKLKIYIKDLGYEKLSDVLATDFEPLMVKFTGSELPFNI